MDEKIVKLKYEIPIPQENNKPPIMTNQLRLGRLKAKHLRLLPDNFMENGGDLNPADVIPLIAGLANIPISAVDEIDIEDLMEVAESLQTFLEVSLPTGEISSGE